MSRVNIISVVYRNRIEKRQLIVGGLVGGVLWILDLKAHLDSGIPYGGDMFSNLIPALYFRAALRSGGDPLITPWYGGMTLWENPFFKGFYPPWGVLFIPGIPVADWLAVMILGHFVGAGIAAYYFARKELTAKYALPIAIIFVLPMANHNAHISKTLAWPWIIIGAWQLRPNAVTNSPRVAGMIVGAAGGAILLIGNAYYALYLGILTGVILIALRAWQAISWAAVSSFVVGFPKILSVIPLLMEEGRDTVLQDGITLKPFLSTLIGFWWESGPIIWPAINKDAYAVVSLPICLIAGTTLIWSYFEPERFPVRWMLGCVSAIIIGLLIATASPLVYRWPGMTMFRVPHRAILIIAVVFLLISVEFIHSFRQLAWGTNQQVQYAVALLLLLGVLNAAAPPILQINMWEDSTQPTVGREVAAAIEANGCSPVWLETNAIWDPDDKSANHHKEIAYALAERGVPTVSTSYAKIGQKYSTHDSNGRLTFEALVLQGGARLPPNDSVTLTGGWFQPDRGQINTSKFGIVEQINTGQESIQIYAQNKRCQ